MTAHPPRRRYGPSPEASPGFRRRLLVFNQYYWPGVEATAQLLAELCEGLARDYSVSVITGRLRGREDWADYELRNGVEVIRVHSTAFDRSPLHGRAANYVTYLVRALRRGLVAKRPDVVLCMTDPPMIGAVAYLVARRFRAPLVAVSQDVFPEIAVELKRLTNPLLVAVLRLLTDFYLRRADRVVVIGDTMRQRVEAKGVDPRRIVVIPNWVDASALSPQPRDNAWSREHGLSDRFVVMHSGNIGHAQDLDTLVAAAKELEHLERLEVVIVGTGARHVHLLQVQERLKAGRVRFVEYQPREVLSLSLSSADVHFVGLARGLAGYVVPSRLYGVLAVGKPVIAAADDASETAQLVRRVGCGVVVPSGDPSALAQAISDLAAGAYDLEEMGRRGREFVEAEAGRATALARYRAVLDSVLGKRR